MTPERTTGRWRSCDAAPEDRGEALRHVVAGILGQPVHDAMLDEPLVRLGLSSLRAFELLHALDEQFGLHSTLDELLDRLTIRDLIVRQRDAHVSGTRAAALTDGAPSSAGAHPLSANQQSIYAAQRMDPDSAAYHICCAARIDRLDPSHLRQALAILTARHPALRARVELRDGQPWQIVDDDVDVSWTEVVSVEPGTDALISAARPHARRPFVLDRAPLWRATLVRREDADGPELLLLTFHHLIADLWSLTILWRDLLAALGAPAETLAPAPCAGGGVRVLSSDRQQRSI